MIRFANAAGRTAVRMTLLAAAVAVPSVDAAQPEDTPGNRLEVRHPVGPTASYTDLEGAGLVVLGGSGVPMFAVAALAQEDAHQIVLRAGGRAMTSGDSKTLGYFSERYDLAGGRSAAEHQALYGVNVYANGSYDATLMGLHGLCMSQPGADHTIRACVGVQGFAWHTDPLPGSSDVLIGVSGTGGTAGNPDIAGRIGTAVGVRGASANRSAAAMSQAISLRGIACENTASGSIQNCYTAQLAQPDDATEQNYALLLIDGDQDGSEIRIGFRDDAGRVHGVHFDQQSRNLELDAMALRPQVCPARPFEGRIDANGCGVIALADGGGTLETLESCDANQRGRQLRLLCLDSEPLTILDDRGNLRLSGDFSCSEGDVLTLICSGTSGWWFEASRADN